MSLRRPVDVMTDTERRAVLNDSRPFYQRQVARALLMALVRSDRALGTPNDIAVWAVDTATSLVQELAVIEQEPED